MFKLNLPFPPSVNHYWRHVGPRVLVSAKGRTYRKEVNAILNRKGIEPLEGDLFLDITLIPPDRRRRDIDNYLKALLDAMQYGGMYLDDCQIVRLTIEKLTFETKMSAAAHVVVQHVPVRKESARLRTCLKCGVAFSSSGPGNRICSRCARENSLLPEREPIVRGKKYHNGELLE